MSTMTTNPLIEITPRGPSVAGTRITVYSVMDLIKANRSREYITQMMPLTLAQVDAVFEYVEQHREEVEAAYARILEREAVKRAEAELIMRERTPWLFDIAPEERHRRLLQRAEELRQAEQARNGNHDSG